MPNRDNVAVGRRFFIIVVNRTDKNTTPLFFPLQISPFLSPAVSQNPVNFSQDTEMISSRGLVSPPRAAPARNPATTMATKTASAAVSTAKTAGLRRNLVVAAAAAAAPAVGRPDAQVVTVLGTQWGDEGKGKLVDILARDFDVVARAQVR